MADRLAEHDALDSSQKNHAVSELNLRLARTTNRFTVTTYTHTHSLKIIAKDFIYT
jgi:hypothetical protein